MAFNKYTGARGKSGSSDANAEFVARIRRIMKREGVSRDYARSRVRAQKPDRFYVSNCSHHIENNYPTAAAFSEAAGALLDQIKGDYTCQS